MRSSVVRPRMCGVWDPASLQKSVLAQDVKLGTECEGRDGRRWVCVALPGVRSGSISHHIAKTHKGESKGEPSVATTPTRETKKMRRPVAIPSVQRVSEATPSFRGVSEAKSKAKHAWALHVDECPVWRMDVPCNLHRYGWWRYSTLPHVDAFSVRDCGGGGNCCFLTILCGWQRNFTGFSRWTHVDVRRVVARQLTTRTIDAFLESEREARVVDRGGAIAHEYAWDPAAVARLRSASERVAATQRIVMSVGDTYWGDTQTLSYLCRSRLVRDLDLGFVVLTPDGVAHKQFFTCHDHRLGPTERRRPSYVMILYNSGTHWQLVTHSAKSGGSWKAIVPLPLRSDDLYEPLRHILVASWGKEWRLTLGY